MYLLFVLITYVFVEHHLGSLSGIHDPLKMTTICRTMSGLNLQRINKQSTTSLRIFWSFYKRYYKMLGSTIKTTCKYFISAIILKASEIKMDHKL
jgi:hypothetical protein